MPGEGTEAPKSQKQEPQVHRWGLIHFLSNRAAENDTHAPSLGTAGQRSGGLVLHGHGSKAKVKALLSWTLVWVLRGSPRLSSARGWDSAPCGR